jgi:hypothetical protein
MPALLRLTAATVAGASALTLAGAALAAPALIVSTSQLVKTAGPATIATREDPGTYRTTVSAPTAYQLPNIKHLNRQIGSATVKVWTSSGALTFTGWVVGAAPENYVDDRCAAFASELHQAVWLMQVRQVDGLARAEIPVFVDQGPSGRTQLTWCASSAADMTVTGVSLRLDRTFLNPLVGGNYAWRAQFDNAQAAARGALGTVTTSATAVVKIRRR